MTVVSVITILISTSYFFLDHMICIEEEKMSEDSGNTTITKSSEPGKGGGIKKVPKILDILYGWPLSI